MGDLFLLDLSLVEPFARVEGCPVLGGVFLAQIVLTRLEGFQCNRVVLVVVVYDLIKVIGSSRTSN